ncbi:MAG: DNA polymerase [Candidatus Brennerbacteria bacterium]
MKNTNCVLLIDSHALIHRAFHALPPLTGPSGEPTGALYGLARILLKVVGRGEFTHIFAAFDRPEPTHRKDAFADYKAHRPKAADELVTQLIEARELFRTFGIPVVEVPKMEADDIIGTLATRFAKEGNHVKILTGDLDALQLVKDPVIAVETFKKGVSETFIYDEAAVRERYGFGPEHVTDLKGIMGDASDNIKGVPGVGEGSALKLVSTYGGLEDIYKALGKEGTEAAAKHAGIQTRFTKIMAKHEKEAFFSRKLATIDTAVPIKIALQEGRFTEVPKLAVTAYFSRMGFESLVKSFADEAMHQPTAPDTDGVENPAFPPGTVFVKNAEDAKKHIKLLSQEEEKVAYGWKEILKALRNDSIKIRGPLFDLSVAGWMLEPEGTDFSREALIPRFLRSDEPSDAALYRLLKKKLSTYGLAYVFEEIEMPLVPILAEMERTGISVNEKRLQELGRTMRTELKDLEQRIYREAGGPFNVNSPRQVAEVLFERLKLGTEKKRRTRTGQRRTGKDILLELGNAHPLIPLLLEYRETFKIFSSFVEPLSAARADDGRVHTTFLQTGTATGRLSSERPNLQNIPQGSKWATSLRSSFIAPKDHIFASFDYSQLELRLLAHTSGDEALRRAFKEGQDIHRLTAAKVFSVPPSDVTPSMRRTAKTLNFGIVYGMGARAFAASSGLPLSEAKRFMEEYFRQFPGVRKWQERVKEEAKTQGYVTNENGRRRWFSAAGKRGYMGEVERAAINMPLQSFGADIIKLAMIQASILTSSPGYHDARMVLSIHDELLFEMPRGMLNTLGPIIREHMESVAKLSIPLRVDIQTGLDWGTMESWRQK